MSIRMRRTTAAATVAVLATTLSGLAIQGSAGAAPPVGREPAPLLLGAPPTSARAAAAPASTRSRLVSLNADALPRKASGQRIDFDLFDDVRVTGIVDSRSTHRNATSWSGRLTPSSIHSDLAGSFNAVRVRDTYVLNINTNQAVYEISRVGGGAYRVTEAGPPPEDTGPDATRARSSRRAARAQQKDLSRAAVPGDSTTVDVAVVYTAATVASAGSQAALDAQIQLGIDQTNQSFANSAVGTSVRLVGTRLVTGDDNAPIADDLDRLRTPGDGYFDEAQGFRDQVHADLVSLWVGGTPPVGSICGFGYYAATPGQGEGSGYTAVAGQDCATTYLVFTHELGHNFGADHDAQSSLSPDTQPYARGFVDPANQRISVMAYYDNCGFPCTRVPYFSNPAISPGGSPIGTADANNARQLNEAFPAVAAYRQSRIYPGTVKITGTPAVEQTLKAVASDWTPAGLGFAYQWSANGSPVSGATAASLKLTSGQVGKRITVQVTGSGGTYTPVSGVSAATPKVAKRLLGFTSRLRGTPRVGKTLSVKVRSSVKKTSYSYKWYRNGTRIKHAKKATLHLVKRDRGKKVFVRVTAKKKGYSTTVHLSRKVRIR